MVWWNKDSGWRNRVKKLGTLGKWGEVGDDERGRKRWNRRRKLGIGQQCNN